MYAIVKSGGKQYRVERGQQLLIERLPDDEGASVALEPILYRSEVAIFDRDGLDRVKVTAKVLGHVRGEKLRVFKFKPKRGYRRRTGHRQELTRIEVTEIAAGSARRSGRARRADASGETAAKAPVKAPEAGEAKAPETAGAKPKGTAGPKPTGTARAKPTDTAEAKPEAKAKDTAAAKPRDTAAAKPRDTPAAKPTDAANAAAAEAKTAEASKPKRAKKSSAQAKAPEAAAKDRADSATDGAEDAETGKQAAKPKKETGEDGT